jgi:hypothetical protein
MAVNDAVLADWRCMGLLVTVTSGHQHNYVQPPHQHLRTLLRNESKENPSA